MPRAAVSTGVLRRTTPSCRAATASRSSRARTGSEATCVHTSTTAGLRAYLVRSLATFSAGIPSGNFGVQAVGKLGNMQLTAIAAYEEEKAARAEKLTLRKRSATEVVQAALGRVEERNPELNAIVEHRAEEALAEATAALFKLASGRIADRAPRKKPLVVAGYTLSTLARPLVSLAAAPTYDGGDQGFLNSYWSDWWAMPVEHRLPAARIEPPQQRLLVGG